ncbi:MAG: flagellin [Firmicutes bacterium]|nr:flagellin [Candidatus Fermentithermobacillaceae bacterium]
MRINTNIPALNAWRNLGITGNMMSKSLEKLSSGYRINRAADDAAGLAISEKMKAQISGLRQASRNAQDGISLIQTAEGALNETHTMLNDMRRLVLQAHNGTNASDDLQKIQQEINALIEEITGIAERAEFNTKSLLTGNLVNTVGYTGLVPDGVAVSDFSGAELGTYKLKFEKDTTNNKWNAILYNTDDPSTTQKVEVPSSAVDVTSGVIAGGTLDFSHFGISIELTAGGTAPSEWKIADGTTLDFHVDPGSLLLQIGANKDQNMDVMISDMRAQALGLTDGTENKVDVRKFNEVGFDFNTQLKLIDDAISSVSTQRSELGAYQNRLEHTINNLDTAAENLDAANSRIRDVDMALEMANFTRHQILQQAGTAMLAQANVTPQAILKLLG